MRVVMRKRVVTLFVCLTLLVTGCMGRAGHEEAGKTRLVDVTGDIWDATISAGPVTIELGMGYAEDKRLAEHLLNRLEGLTFTEDADAWTDDSDMGQRIIDFSVRYEDMMAVYVVHENVVCLSIISGTQETYYSAAIDGTQYQTIISCFLPCIAEKYFYGTYDVERGRSSEETGRLTGYLDVAGGKDYTEQYIRVCKNDQTEYNILERYDTYLYYERYEFSVNDLDLADTVGYYSVVSDGRKGYERYNEYPNWDVIPSEQVPDPDPLLTGLVDRDEPDDIWLLRENGQDIINEVYVSDAGELCLAYFGEDTCKLAYVKDGNVEFITNYHAFCDERGADETAQIFDTIENMVLHGNGDGGTQDIEDSQDGQGTGNQFKYSFAFNENSLFDFEAERIRGENIENPHVVESYRDYFETADSYTIRITSRRGDMRMYSFTTKSGDDYYYEDGLQNYGEKCLISKSLGVDGKNFYQIYEEGETVTYNLDVYNGSGLYVAPIIWADGEYSDDDTFVEAYEVTIQEENYICEVWHSGLTDYNIYCKDDRVVAMEAYYKIGTEQGVIEYLSDDAEMEYIVMPDDYVVSGIDE